MKILNKYEDIIWAIMLILIVPFAYLQGWVIYFIYQQSNILTGIEIEYMIQYGNQFNFPAAISYILSIIMLSFSVGQILYFYSAFNHWKEKTIFTRLSIHILIPVCANIILFGMTALYEKLL